jgi:Flp pilus assembly protein TadD
MEEDYRAMAKNYDAAVEIINPAPRREHWGLYYQRGIAYERLKEWDMAEPNFKKALELFPDHPQVLNYLGYSWIDMNIHLEEGLAMIQKAVAARPTDGYIVDSLGWAYYRLGRYDDAVHELERAVTLKESDPTINDHLGDAYWRVGRKLEATFQWKRVLSAEPDDELADAVNKKLEEGLPPVKDGKPLQSDNGNKANDNKT